MLSKLTNKNLLRYAQYQHQNVSSRTTSTNDHRTEVNFDSISAAYGYKSKSEIFRGWFVFKLCSYTSLVDHLGKLFIRARALIGQNLFQSIMRSTLYGHFVAGTDKHELKPIVERLRKHGVKLILDYCMESDIGNSHLNSSKMSTNTLYKGNIYDDNMMKAINNVNTAAELCGSSAITAVKVTAFVTPNTLQKLNSVIEQEKPSKTVSILDLISKKTIALNNQERNDIENLVERMNLIIQEVDKNQGKIFIDAEQSYFQTAIHKLALELQKDYNRNRLIVYNTYQCYRKSTLGILREDLVESKTNDFYIGCKLVRGAYMDQERKRAIENNSEDPIHPNFDATTESYHRAFLEILENVKTNKKIHVIVASHNEDTVQYALKTMNSMNVKPNDGVVSFATLFGMCDYLTFPLAAVGYDAYKLAPYGPIDRLLPYLTRRAQENRAIFDKAKKDRRLHFQALKKRCLGFD